MHAEHHRLANPMETKCNCGHAAASRCLTPASALADTACGSVKGVIEQAGFAPGFPAVRGETFRNWPHAVSAALRRVR